MRRNIIITALVVLAAILSYFFFFQKKDTQQVNEVLYTVEQAAFPITVVATGELDSKKSVKIRGPQGMRSARIFETTISDLVPEGTILQEGDYVGKLDQTELANRMGNIQVEIDKIKTQLEQAKIDTAINMRDMRDQIVNTQFSLKEKRLSVDLNKYEAKSIIRQTQLELEKAERDYQQLLEQYELKQRQADAQIEEIMTNLRKNEMEMQQLLSLSDQFTITAPSDGMLIYSRDWNGKKEPGSRVTAWDPVVAELPDLTDMISKLYVNEVDISKVTKGQPVDIKIDAFPDVAYTGTVIQVANIGEQVRGYDTKVFEVIVQVNETDSIMRPAMTTSNEVLTALYEEVLSVPLEAIQADSLSYVYVMNGKQITAREVIPGPANNNGIMIKHGLQAGEQVLLTLPDPNKEYPVEPIDPAIKTQIQAELAAELAQRKAEAQKRAASIKEMNIRTSDGSGGGGMIIIN
ncbi:MAG TPA: HlyD family efflux transporter periplasmic adaptor subunit [Saprospiraceae bacterium]|nr:HlyD family efflux transporter periplasmic adaptor subunit [Saprospiraceae bacterium]